MTPFSCSKISLSVFLFGLIAKVSSASPTAHVAPAAASTQAAPKTPAPAELTHPKKAAPKYAPQAGAHNRGASARAPAAPAASAPAATDPSNAPLAVSDKAAVETPIGCDDDPDCAESVQHAISQSESQQYAAALHTYEAIYGRWPTPWLLINLGRVQQKLNQPARAIETYQSYLKIAPTDKPQRIAVARAFLKQAEQEVQLKRYQQMLSEAKGKEKPIYRKWWFWTGLGGLAAVGAAATIGGLLVTQNAQNTRPPYPANTLFFSLYHGSY